jgi:uncharacterized protein DUF6970
MLSPSFYFMVVMPIACASNPVGPGSASSIPAWLTALTHDIEAQPVANPPAYVARYDYKGESVYFLPQRCCDVMAILYRADGSIMCHPEGGLTGTGDGRCADFFVERKNEQVVATRAPHARLNLPRPSRGRHRA